jgi:elongation factor Ts
MEVTAQMVKDLRVKTGAGIMDCKEALRENDGDLDEAVRFLREKGLSSAAKKAGREASDGLVESSVESGGRSGVLVEVNCETDFVAKTDDFQGLVGKVIARVKENGGEGLGEEMKVEASEAISKLGENIVITRGERYGLPEGAVGRICSYIHPGGAIGVMVDLRCGGEEVAGNAEFAELGRDLAMHIAASSPLYLDREAVPQTVVESERAILIAQSKDSGKPENIIEKMVEGRINKYLKEVCLMDQPFVKDPDQTIKSWLAAHSKDMGEELEISRFLRYQRGEHAGSSETE